MGWAAFLPDNVAKHPEHFVGPNVAGTMVQCLEYGILINQSFRFWSRAQSEPRALKLLVAFVSCVAAFQTAIAIYNTWRVVVLGFGNAVTVVALGWPDRIQPALNCIMAAPFQAFLIWRCWNVLQRRWIILAPLVSLLLADVVMNIYITVEIFYINSIASVLDGPPHLYITAFVLTAVLDMMITALMSLGILPFVNQNLDLSLAVMWFLLRVKKHVISRHLAKVLVRLHRMIWEAAVPPCACAIAACVIYITMSEDNLWDVFLQSILGKLYVISLFVILNGRADLKRSLPVSTNSTRMSQYWATDASVQFRVDLTSVMDRREDSEMEPATPTTEAPLHRSGRPRVERKSPLSLHLQRSRGPLEGAGRVRTVAPAHKAFSFEMQGEQAETSSFLMVTRPPTVLHRPPWRGDWRMSC